MTPKSATGNKKSYRPFSDKKTLELAKQALLFVTNILENEKITYFLDHGTLLGIIRDGDLIPWDADLSVEEKDMHRVIELIKQNITSMPMNDVLGWNALVYYKEDNIPVKILISYNEDNIEDYKIFPISIVAFKFENGQAIQKLSYSEEYHFKDNEYIDCCGEKLSIPYDYKRYLEIHYGDWKIAKKDTTFLDVKNYKMSNIIYRKDKI